MGITHVAMASDMSMVKRGTRYGLVLQAYMRVNPPYTPEACTRRSGKILEEYPQLSREDILACVAYGAEMSRERFVDIPLERPA